MAEQKSIFESRTAALAGVTMLAGLVALRWPAVGQWVAENSPELLILLGAANVVLRLVTRDSVRLWVAIGLCAFAFPWVSGCGALPPGSTIVITADKAGRPVGAIEIPAGAWGGPGR